MSLNQSSLSLGIDIGTTKVACCLVDPRSRASVASSSEVHKADVLGLKIGRSEQRVSDILLALDRCINQLPSEGRARVKSIGITGQMHGVVLWNEGDGEVSNLITWQDQRCLENGFLSEIQEISGDRTLQTGYGIASLAWLVRHDATLLSRFGCAGTIHDYVAALISDNLGGGLTDPSDAASFGCFDSGSLTWRSEVIKRLEIPINLMALIKDAGEKVGGLGTKFSQKWGIQEAVPVCNAIGDNQASIYGSLSDPATQVSLTIGTGAQLSVVVPCLPDGGRPSKPSFEYRPYVGGTFLAVAASLSGGRALASLAAALEEFMRSCGVEDPPTLETIQSAMHEAGLAKKDTDLRANASLGGERHTPDLKGSFSNLTFNNFTIADMTAAMCRGLVTSLRDSIPGELLIGKKEVVGSGNAIRRSPLMQQIIREVFQCELSIKEDSEATACGAALLAADRCAI